MKSLTDRVAIVTGAARGIGAGIADVLSAEGATVIVADLDLDAAETQAATLRDQGRAARAHRVDVSDRASVQHLVTETVEAHGRLDIVAVNAGIYPFAPLGDIDEALWQRIIGINLTGAFYCVQAAVDAMRPHGWGRIVLTSSITGPITGQSGYAHYGATKAGMLGMMRSVAVEVAGDGITVNAVMPGNIATPGFADLGAEHERRMLSAIPAARFGSPQDVGWCVRFLASEEASYVTGQTLIVDGGQVLPESAPGDA